MNTASTTQVCLACYKDRLASVCENADEYRLFDIRDNNIYPAGLLSLPSKDPMDRTSAILACGVSFLLCGAICARALSRLEAGGMTVIPWLSGEVDEVLRRFQDDSLLPLVMPGCLDAFHQQCEKQVPAEAGLVEKVARQRRAARVREGKFRLFSSAI